MVRPVYARALEGITRTVCVNVSGLSRVSCCCSQAMMRSARDVPTNLVRAKARFPWKGLRRADRLFRHHSTTLAICYPDVLGSRLAGCAGRKRLVD